MKINLEEILNKLTDDFDSYKDYSYLSESYTIHFEKDSDGVYLVCEDTPIVPKITEIESSIKELHKIEKYISKNIEKLTFERMKINKNIKGVNGFERQR